MGFTVAATGGPLALVALYVPQSVAARRSMGLVVALSILAFAAPLAVWYRYSEQVASSGGLYAFVEAAAGRRAAQVQGAVWVVSYALYLPYTITYIVYDLLPVVVPGVRPYRAVLEVVLPVAFASVGLLRLRTALGLVGALAAGQVVLLVILWAAGTHHVGAPAGTFGAHGPVGPLLRGGAGVSLLFICSSLVLFLGGEIRGGGAVLGRSLVTGTAIAMAAVLVGALVWTRAGAGFLSAPIPGMALARAVGGHAFAVVVGLAVAASVAGVVLAEYFALGRLLHAMTGRPISRTTAAVAAGFVIADVLSLIDPNAFYNELVKPSLVALWVSQLVVFGVYPRFAARRGRLGPAAVGLAGAATALTAYGLYSALTLVTST